MRVAAHPCHSLVDGAGTAGDTGTIAAPVSDPFLPTMGGSGIVSRQLKLRSDILAAVRQILASEGESDGKFTIARLADTCHITPQTIHNNFGTRADLLASAVKDHYYSVQAQAVELFDSPLFCFGVAQAYVDCAESTPAYVRAIARNNIMAEPQFYGNLHASCVRIKLPAMQRLSHQGWLRENIDPLILTKQIIRQNSMICYEWAIGHCDLSDLRRQLMDGTALLMFGVLDKRHAPAVDDWIAHHAQGTA